MKNEHVEEFGAAMSDDGASENSPKDAFGLEDDQELNDELEMLHLEEERSAMESNVA